MQKNSSYSTFKAYFNFLAENKLLNLKEHQGVPYFRFFYDEKDTLILIKGDKLQLLVEKKLSSSIALDDLSENEQREILKLFTPSKAETKTDENLIHLLKQVYGYDNFRGRQSEIISSIINQQDTLVLMPTGAGKSICFQIPALHLPGTAIVISPLISLMQNQVMNLQSLGVKAEFINSSLSSEEVNEIKSRIQEIKLLYISPERFNVPSFQSWLKTLNISFFAIDEAHCVSTWGHDFRPDYTNLKAIKEVFNKPIIALTATADLRTREDIPVQLKMSNFNTFISSFDRPNIKLLAEEKEDYKNKILKYLQDFKGESGIIYCLSRKKVEELTEFLEKKGFEAYAYHAGLSQSKRTTSQEAFILKENVIVVATIAFGMGIDKPNVRFVIHVDMPQNLESYYQEIGRAGRDGEDSTAILLYGMQDFIMRQNMIYQGESTQKMAELGKLQEMLAFADTISCKRNYLMKYFGNEPVSCGNCSSCLSTEPAKDMTSLANQVIKAIRDTGEYFGMNYIALLLKGSDSKQIRENHKNLEIYGAAKEESEDNIKKTMRQMIVQGHLKIDLDNEFNNLLISNEVIFEPIEIKPSSKKKGFIKDKSINYTAADAKSDLLEQLKVKRLELAQLHKVPPFMVLHDKTLKEMAKKKPQSLEELESIHGWGEKKIEKYGSAFIDFFNHLGEE